MENKKVEQEVEVEVGKEVTDTVECSGENFIRIPKKIFYIDSDLDIELFRRLVDFTNDYADTHLIEIWLSSPGGDCMVTEMIRDLIEEYQMPIVGCYLLGSSAFNLFITANVYKALVPGTK